MISKLGVKLDTLRPELAILEPLVDAVFDRFHRMAVCTSTNDGIHGPRSLHYKDAAFDLRMNFFNTVIEQRECHATLKGAIAEKYPMLYDVLLEYAGTPRAHIHIEPSPVLCKQMGLEGY